MHYLQSHRTYIRGAAPLLIAGVALVVVLPSTLEGLPSPYTDLAANSESLFDDSTKVEPGTTDTTRVRSPFVPGSQPQVALWIPLERPQWFQSSPPTDVITSTIIGVVDSIKMRYKAHTSWANPEGVISPTGGSIIKLRYYSRKRGQHNLSVPLGNLVQGLNWGGMTHRFDEAPVNVQQERYDFIDLWMNVASPAAGEKLYIDLGTVSEDIIPNNSLNSEDLVIVDKIDGKLGPGEDVGLDMMTDFQEQQNNLKLVELEPEDPAGDNYSASDPMRLNGTEGNGGLPDTEDLNRNGVVDTIQSFFTYELPLDTTFTANRFIIDRGDFGFYHIRIPIREHVRQTGNPSLFRIEHMRLWFAGVAADSIVVNISGLGFSRIVELGAPVTDTSAYVVYMDSTARLTYFTPVRKPSMQTELFPARTYPLFARNNASSFKREVVFDSSSSAVHFRETLGGSDVRIPLSLPLNEYLAARQRSEWQRLLAEESQRYTAVQSGDELGDVLSAITKIQIPVPPNPILSIFGKPEINLSISGAVDIKAGFRTVTSDQTTLSAVDQTRNEPDFSQEVQVNVNGTIGDKLNILADWNTRRTFEYENQLKIKYTGYADEIVQSVEAGNVSLGTPSAFIGSSQALFGIKTKFQAGPLTLTAIASQKKGQIKEVTVTGGSQQNTFDVSAVDYATDYFFVDTTYRRFYEPYYQTEPITITPEQQNLQIVEHEVWVSLTSQTTENPRSGVAHVVLPERGPGYTDSIRSAEPLPGLIERSQFIRLDPTQYELVGDGYTGIISLLTTLQESQVLALAYRTADGRQFGEFTSDNPDTTLVLKLVRPRGLSPTHEVAWEQMLKSVYKLRLRNVKREGFDLDLVRDSVGGVDIEQLGGRTFNNMLGLDIYGQGGELIENGDNFFDFRVGRTINPGRGEVILPYLRPFDDGIRQALQGTPDSTIIQRYTFPLLYDTTSVAAGRDPTNKYRIKGQATGDASSKFNLGFNIVEGSVDVLLNGQALTPNIDYTVDYILGEVIIRKAEALLPGANVQIKFEQNDLFQLASKTLLGARGDLAISSKTNLGFTIMNLNQQSLSDKVRLNEEPNQNSIFGIDGSTSFDLPILTSLFDLLPFYASREMSNMRISGEAAYMLPDPNTRKSPITGDGGEGVAYIDDFEGSRRSIPLGVNYIQWTQASPPADAYFRQTVGTDSADWMDRKGRLIWYNVLPTQDRLTDVYPQKQVGNAANDQVTVLDVAYQPKQRGQFNYAPTPLNSTSPQNWAGLMKPISVAPTKLISENINYIEVWMQVLTTRPASDPDTLYIDLGSISEDVIPNGQLNSEDLILSRIPTGTLQEGEDIGLDMLKDENEPGYNAGSNPDPSGDNYAYDNTIANYSRINGTEANLNGPGGRSPDTEDLNFNADLDRLNDYFHYKIVLVPDSSINPQIVGGGNPGFQGLPWYQYRIPIREFADRIGTPDFDRVESLRFYFANAKDTALSIRIADFSLTGNQWEEASRRDSFYSVSVVSIEETPSYTSPPGVVRERDKSRPDQDIFANEQSLALNLNQLPDGGRAEARKFYNFRPLDVFNYRTMKMFVYGDQGFQYIDETNYDAEVFFRFGADTLNFYEYRAPLKRGWDPGNEIVIRFDQLTAIKQGRDSTNIITPPIPVEGGPPGAVFRVLGNPSLTVLRYMALGVENPFGRGVPGQPLNGQVWFNELRVIDVDDSPGLAYRVDTQLKLADLATVAFNYSRTDPSFHSLEQRFGTRQTNTTWGFSTSIQVEKLFLSSWAGTSLPFSYSHAEGFTQAKYLPNSDVLVAEAADRERQKVIDRGGTEEEASTASSNIYLLSETKRVSNTYAMPSFRIMLPTEWWLIRDTFNKLSYGANYTESDERSPSLVYRSAWSWNTSIRYALTLPPDYFLSPFVNIFDGAWFLDEYKGYKLFFPIQSFNWSVGFARSRDASLQRQAGAREAVARNFTSTRQFGFTWKLSENGLISPSGDYNVTADASLVHLELDPFGNERPFSEIMHDIFGGDKLINFGRTTRYGQRLTVNTRPGLPNIFGVKKYLDLSFGYSVDYAWLDNLQNELGRSSSVTNNITASTTFRMKALFDPIWEDTPTSAQPPPAQPRGRRGATDPTAQPDTTAALPDTTTESPSRMGRLLGVFKTLTKVFIKIPLLDYETINITFAQTNNATNSGIIGSTGFLNFWSFSQNPADGPVRLYQLGLLSDPSGTLKYTSRSTFPWIGWDVEPGLRVPNGNLTNNYRQTNRVGLKTSRGLWEGARLDLNWNISWSYNRMQSVLSDSFGVQNILNTTRNGSIERSFLTFPDFLFLGLFNTGLENVGKKYGELKASGDSSVTNEEKLATAFEEGFEAFPWLKSVFGQYYPRINWAIRWDGLEKISFFSGFVSRLSLDHSYNSTYSRNYRNVPGRTGEKTEGQRVSYGFSPLIGLNFTFKELFKGSFGANFRYNATTSFDLGSGARYIVETFSKEISITASYARRGFEIPIFGVSLSNDIDVSFSYSVTLNSRFQYDTQVIEFNQTGEPRDGQTRTTLEPRIRYVLSSRVTASIYYRHSSLKPETGSPVPGNTTNEAGLDLHIAIQ